jgi:hypothetical protein
MIRMKNLLAENMRRFGTKNLAPLCESTLSDDDILDIIMTYTKDVDKAQDALDAYRETGDFGDDAIDANVTADPRWIGTYEFYYDKIKSGDYNSPEELAQLHKKYFKTTNTKMKTRSGIEGKFEPLGRKLTPEEFKAMDDLGLIWHKTPSTSSSEDFSDFVRDIKAALGTRNSSVRVTQYLGRRLSKPEFNALLRAGVIAYRK